MLKYLKLSDYFVDIVDPAQLAQSKPAPDIYIQAAKQLGLSPDEVAGVEDAQSGVDAINAADELSIGIGTNLTNADVRFDQTSDVSLEALKAKLQ